MASDDKYDAQGWSAKLYSQSAAFVYSPAYTAPVLDLLQAQPGEKIIDFGCGSGQVTFEIEQIVKQAPGGFVVGVDSSESMIAKCKEAEMEHAFVSDIQRLDIPMNRFNNGEENFKFDAVFSNATLHWCKRDPAGVLESVKTVLKPRGRLLVEMGGMHNCIGIRSHLHRSLQARRYDPVALDPWFFPSVEEYSKLLTTAGFVIKTITLVPRVTPLSDGVRGWLEVFARTSILKQCSEQEANEIIDEVVDAMKVDCLDNEGNWSMMYTRLSSEFVILLDVVRIKSNQLTCLGSVSGMFLTRVARARPLISRSASTYYRPKMGKKSKTIPETLFKLTHPAVSPTSPIVDTHTHLASTFEAYRHKYPDGKYADVFDFVRGLYSPGGVQEIIDVWCEAPVRPIWREFADAALTEQDRQEKWGGMGYWFVMGVHPHEAKHYNDAVEADILEAMKHPRCVGWGEMGLDYHYDNSPREIQQEVFARQLRQAVRLNKPLTIHTREADEDTERILKEEVPKEHKIHIHCFTDSPAFAQRLLDWFPNLYIGVTGVITFATNADTSTTVRNMFSSEAPQPSNIESRLRILLETDAPYMVPAPIYTSPAFTSPEAKGKRLAFCHSAMVPWTASFVADLLPKEESEAWDTSRVLSVARSNAKAVYGV
ncbi:hypothetical protein MIND_00869900 [Mycena indigotica]|uniref:Methyltransferase domain-containing protein n=1 Tax=Mycena indigotica TaxID=2126181 RepID=A0A8H6SHZ4_9AGAR|nr:uncharacterized protein MIND_00869900 [Mycena indigotica]KAF7299212.1 hypothetical protein MIND_00869900 [Mycena indigotica]